MQLDLNLRVQYNPARIYPSTYPNANHVSEPQFSDKELEKPNPPIEPTFVQDNRWMPIGWTIWLLLLCLIPIIRIFALCGLIGLWVWAISTKPSVDPNKVAALKEEYIKAERHYVEIELPEWEKNKPYIKKEKLSHFQNNIMNYVIKQKGWSKVLKVDEKYIGPGEKEVFESLCMQGVKACPHVQIQYSYPADIVCFNLRSGKLCVVEIDGRQHWEDPNQVERDNQRMQSLAAQGIPTIRFINFFARENSNTCVGYINNLLA